MHLTSSSYYTLMVWFPELFNRYEDFESKFPNQTASVCDVSGIVVTEEETNPFNCGETIDSKVYTHTLIVGLACIPTSLWLPLCVHKLGAKFFLSKLHQQPTLGAKLVCLIVITGNLTAN